MLRAHQLITTAAIRLGLALIMSINVCCSSRVEGPSVLHISADQYAAAFDAAQESARSHGLTGGLRDRRAGIIETEPRIAGSVIEPWRTDNATNVQAVENTLNYQRRRARFEFQPVGFQQPSEPVGDSPIGPNLLSSEPTIDLNENTADLELRVWVFVERSHATGIRRSTWTRTKTTASRVIDPDTGDTFPSHSWTAVRRDVDYERRLLASVASQLGLAADAASVEAVKPGDPN